MLVGHGYPEKTLQTPNDTYLYPGVGDALSYGWNGMKSNFLMFFLVVLVLIVADVSLEMTTDAADVAMDDEHEATSTVLNLIGFAYWLLFLPLVGYGADLIFLRGVRGDTFEITDIISRVHNYLNIVLASLLVFGLIGISLFAFIIPGIYVATRLAFVSYLVMDEDLDPIAAVEGSWRMTKGHAWKIFVLGFISLLLGIVGFLLIFVGLIPAIMWAKAAFAAMYLSISEGAAEEYRHV